MVLMPKDLAAATAASTFAELPEVEIAIRQSPAFPKACTCLAKMSLKE